MPRKPRFNVPGALHHIMVCGNNKANIFDDGQDKSEFLQRLGENIAEARCSVYAWVLMSNHGHICNVGTSVSFLSPEKDGKRYAGNDRAAGTG